MVVFKITPLNTRLMELVLFAWALARIAPAPVRSELLLPLGVFRATEEGLCENPRLHNLWPCDVCPVWPLPSKIVPEPLAELVVGPFFKAINFLHSTFLIMHSSNFTGRGNSDGASTVNSLGISSRVRRARMPGGNFGEERCRVREGARGRRRMSQDVQYVAALNRVVKAGAPFHP